MSAFTENDLRHSASLLHKLNSIDDKISNSISDIEVGVRNLWAKKYMMDWNDTYAGTATKGSDEYGEYIQIEEPDIWNYIANKSTKTDIFGGKIKFEEGKQYYFKVKWRNASTDPNNWGIAFYINYTDGSQTAFSASSTVCNTTEPSIKMLKTDSTKTVASIGTTYNTHLAITRIYEIQLVQATKQPNAWLVAPEDLIDYTDTSIANIEIGGRNLLLNSKPYNNTNWKCKNGTVSFDGNIIKGQTTSDWSRIYTDQFKNYNLIEGDEYTFSAMIRSNVAGKRLIFIGDFSGLVNNIKFYEGEIGTEWTCIVKTAKVTNTNTSDSYLQISIPSNWSAGASTDEYIELKELKLEKGNKVTAWTPAPEDIDATIDAK